MILLRRSCAKVPRKSAESSPQIAIGVPKNKCFGQGSFELFHLVRRGQKPYVFKQLLQLYNVLNMFNNNFEGPLLRFFWGGGGDILTPPNLGGMGLQGGCQVIKDGPTQPQPQSFKKHFASDVA